MDKQKENLRRLKLLDEAEERAIKYQEQNLAIDFDTALSEHEKSNKPHIIKFRGKRYTISATIPISLSLFIQRECVQKQRQADGTYKEIFVFPENKFEEFLERLCGKRFAKTIIDSNTDAQFVAKHIIPDILELWGTPLQKGIEKKTGTTDTIAG